MLNTSNKKEYIFLIASIVIGVLIKLLVPVCYDLTPVGVTYLAIFVPTILMWCFVGTSWTSLLAMAAMIMFNVVPTGTLLSSSFMHMTPYTTILVTIIIGKLNEEKVMHYVAKWFISRKIVHNRPYMFLVFWALVLFLFGITVGQVTGFIIMLSLIHGTCESIGEEKRGPFHKVLCMFTIWVGIIGEAVLGFTIPVNLNAVSIMNGLGFDWITMDIMKVNSIPIAIVSILAAFVVIKFVLRPDMSKFYNYDDAQMREELKSEGISKLGKFLIIYFVIFILCIAIIPAWFKGAFPTYLATINMAGVITIMWALLHVITIDKKPVCNLRSDAKYISWPVYIFLSCMFLFSGTLSSPDYGIVSTLVKILAPVTANMSITMVIVLGAIITLVLTNVMSNVVSCFVVLSVAMPVLQNMGASSVLMQTAACIIITTCSLDGLVPAGSPANGIILGAEIQVKESFKYTLVYELIAFVILIAVILALGPIMYA